MWTTLLVSMMLGQAPLKVATFEVDVTPPLGTPLCDALVPPAKQIVDPLSARGFVLITERETIAIVAIDWVGIGNGGHLEFRKAIMKSTKASSLMHVCLHSLHQHDAPGCDFEADEVLVPHKLGGKLFDPEFARTAIERVAKAAAKAIENPRVVTHVAVGKAKVVDVASNRRVLGEDGMVKFVRYSATKDPLARAEPEGVIDPYVHLFALYDKDEPVLISTYYATHPQSHYGKGGVSCDFPGLARGIRERQAPAALHIHFNGAGGNVTAGKYNDGSPENRMVLAGRLAAGMKEALASSVKDPVTSKSVILKGVVSTALPLNKKMTARELGARVADETLLEAARLRAARDFVWARRCESKNFLDRLVHMHCVKIGPAYIVHMPGELFVEYQLAAQAMRPGSPVMMAAYGDYGMGYIGTAKAYTQGGYETGPVSRVAPEVEEVLMNAMRTMLK